MTKNKPPAGPVTNLLEVEGDNALRHLATDHENFVEENNMSEVQIANSDSTISQSVEIRLKVDEREFDA